jgi:hypothetical protein
MFGDKKHINNSNYGIGTKCGYTGRWRSNSECKIIACSLVVGFLWRLSTCITLIDTRRKVKNKIDSHDRLVDLEHRREMKNPARSNRVTSLSFRSWRTSHSAGAENIQTWPYFSWLKTLVRVFDIVFFLLGDSLASEFYVPKFRSSLFHLNRWCKHSCIQTYEDGIDRGFRNVDT